MSSLSSAARARAPRIAAAALERARLSVVPTRASRASRVPFAVLVFVILGAGVVGLLMFNTHMQQGSFYATSLQTESADLTARSQSLEMNLERLRDPQRLANAARALGMVAPSVPAFIRLSDGRILGVPTPATANDAVRVWSAQVSVPAPLAPAPLVVKVLAKPKPAAKSPATSKTSAHTGTASTTRGTAKGRNGAATSPQGVHR